MHKLRKLHIILMISLFVLVTLPGCSDSPTHPDLAMAPMSGMPAEVQNAAVSVQEAYQFSAANPELMKQIPCYCGCGDIGHTSNYSCYVNEDGNSSIQYDTHALGCSICVDITQDVMRMTRDGTPLDEIRADIDSTYSKYGISNIP